MTPEEYQDQVLNSPWYTVVNDLIGGWAIALEDKPLSHLDVQNTPVVAEFLTQGIAQYVMCLHNGRLLG